ncbi:MAG: hypothetical protein CM1200mP36_07490 [Gammaproteobacteria bacterium]|nr:MAG: hypothetical protein CM1200mP36_07490 [Gammaproteobacteria bacterium]
MRVFARSCLFAALASPQDGSAHLSPFPRSSTRRSPFDVPAKLPSSSSRSSCLHTSPCDGEAGEETAWQIETYPPGMLMRKGLTRRP